jgi:tetratricopeptide (TPR) repeat protein
VSLADPLARIFAVALALTASAAAADTDQGITERAEFDAGQAAYESGKFEEALRHYLEAYRLNHDATLLFSVGECYRRLKNYPKAKLYYQKYLSELPKAPYAELVLDLIKQMEALTPPRKTKVTPPPETPPVVSAPTVVPPAPDIPVAPPAEPPSSPVIAPPPVAPEATAVAPLVPGISEPPGPESPTPRASILTKWWFWLGTAAVLGAGGSAGYLLLRPKGRIPTLGTLNSDG